MASASNDPSAWPRYRISGLHTSAGPASVRPALGAIGLYLARVYKDSIGLPVYVVDEKLTSPATQAVRAGLSSFCICSKTLALTLPVS